MKKLRKFNHAHYQRHAYVTLRQSFTLFILSMVELVHVPQTDLQNVLNTYIKDQ